MANVVLKVDLSDVQAMTDALRKMYTRDKFNQIMYRVLDRTRSRTKTLTQAEVPHDYRAPKPWIGRAFQKATIVTGRSFQCTIPLDGTRGLIGNSGPFKAKVSGESSGGGSVGVRKAYEGRRGKRARRAYKINAQIVISGASTLPSTGDQPHFMVFTGRYKGRVFVRMDKKGDHIRPAVGIGVPQMPMSRTKEAVQEGVLETVKKRIEQEHAFELRRQAGRWMK